MSSISQPTQAEVARGEGPLCVVVPIDLGAEADRALPVGAALAEQLGVDLDVMCVGSRGTRPQNDESEVRWHAQQHGVDVHHILLSYEEDVAAAILAETAVRHGLICCATHAWSAPVDLFVQGVSGQLVRHSTAPLVLVGPHIATAQRPCIRNVVPCVDRSNELDELLTATTGWARLLSAPVHVVEVGNGEHDYPTAELAATHLAERDIDATWVVLPDGDAGLRIVDFSATVDDPLLVVGSRSPVQHGPAALGHVSRTVVRHAACPVLVVPLGELKFGT